jgi:hypothetical protein
VSIFECDLSVALLPLRFNIPDMFEGYQVTIEVPFGYAQRDQLLRFIKSKFPGAEISIVQSEEVVRPTVSEVLVRHDSETESEESDSLTSREDSEAVLLKASDALSEFTKSAG